MKNLSDIYENIYSFDVETTGLSAYHGNEIFAYCIGETVKENLEIVDSNLSVYRIDEMEEYAKKLENIKLLKSFWKDTSKKKVIHNAKFELMFLDVGGIEVPENSIIHDTMIISQIINNICPSHALDYLCKIYNGYKVAVCDSCADNFEVFVPRMGRVSNGECIVCKAQGEMSYYDIDGAVEKSAKANEKKYNLIPKFLMFVYQLSDAERPLLLFHSMMPRLLENGKMYLDYLNEIELIKVTQQMEKFGINVDVQNTEEISEWLNYEIEKVSNETFDLLGEYVNLNSDDVVKRLFYKKYNFPVLSLTDKNEPSTDKDVIIALKNHFNHPIFDLILKQRSYTKGLSTIKSYTKLSDVNGIIHTNINTNFARTGRQSSNNPNLHNVSKEAVEKNPFPVPLRKCFRAPLKEIMFLSDYSGIELRLIVEATGEDEMIDLLIANPDADLHHLTAECFLMPEIFFLRQDKVYAQGVENAKKLKEKDPKKFKIIRSAYKNTGFCIAYGGGVEKVALTLAKQVDEIRIGDANYRRRFPKINKFTKEVVAEVLKNGFIETAFGRILYIPRDKAYIGSNYKIQGTAAGILKRAQVQLAKFYKKELNGRMRIILSIHDEIIHTMSRKLLKYQDEILTEVSKIMTDMPEIKVPLRVEHKCTTTDWNSAKPFTFEEKKWSAKLTNESERIINKVRKSEKLI